MSEERTNPTEDKPQEEQPAPHPASQAESEIAAQIESEATSEAEAEADAADEYKPVLLEGALFPHELPTEHWNVDFADTKKVYQGADLPIWILAGWASFIIWALVYLYFGLSEF